MWARFSLEGIARKVALVTVTLSAIGYFIFVIGWGKYLSSLSINGSQVGYFAFWYCVAAGPLVFICCLLRVVLLLQRNAHYVLMVITSMFISSYISAGGHILYYFGFERDQDVNVNLIFAGMIITQLFSRLRNLRARLPCTAGPCIVHNRSLNGVVEFMRRKTISIAGKIQNGDGSSPWIH
ncbi:hypothetical protein EMCRGX_G028767 [Ephydatia muelleri]